MGQRCRARNAALGSQGEDDETAPEGFGFAISAACSFCFSFSSSHAPAWARSSRGPYGV